MTSIPGKTMQLNLGSVDPVPAIGVGAVPGDGSLKETRSRNASVSSGQRSNFDLEPNPFEQSFASNTTSRRASPSEVQVQQAQVQAQPQVQAQVQAQTQAQTQVQAQTQAQGQNQSQPNQTLAERRSFLPPVTALASPSSLIPNVNASLWPGSLRSGPLSPAMLQGPQNARSDELILGPLRPTNESGLRTGLTPGGSGSMFPTPGPATAEILGLSGAAATSSDPLAMPIAPTTPSLGGALRGIPLDNGVPHTGLTPYKGDYGVNGVAGATVVNGVTGATVANGVNGASGGVGGVTGANGVGGGVKDPLVAANSLFMLSQGPGDDAKKKKRGADKKRKRKVKSEDGQSEPNDNELNDNDTANEDETIDSSDPPKRKRATGSKWIKDEEKRKEFLEKNRVAALRCRQRKKEWLNGLQDQVTKYQEENKLLKEQVNSLTEQLNQVRAILTQQSLANKDLISSSASTVSPINTTPKPEEPNFINSHGTSVGIKLL